MSKFQKPSKKGIKRPDPTKGQNQSFSSTVLYSGRSFESIKEDFISSPKDFLSNSKAEFHAPVDGDNNPSEFIEGSFIQIDIDGPLNNSFVQVEDITESENSISTSFVTLKGHIEKGEISFGITQNEDGSMTFSINSLSEVDFGMAPEKFARNQQIKSWVEVLDRFVEISQGVETSRVTPD
jgi:hypothetical protein